MLNRLKNNVKNAKKNVKGAVSIIMVIFILILATAFTLLIDLSSTMFGMKEIQSKIDIAGINALYNSIDYTQLRDETLGVVDGGSITSGGSLSSDMNEHKYIEVIRNRYINELQQIKYPGENPKIQKSEVRFVYNDFGVGYNAANGSTSAKSRPQVVLESIVSYDVSSSVLIDEFTRNVKKSVKSTYSNSEFSVTVSDRGKDGKSTVMLHSITRIILK